MGMIAAGQIGFSYCLGATDTFGDILAGQFEMDTAGVCAFGPMNGKIFLLT